MKSKSTYSEKLKDPRWQKKRLEILERDKWTCFRCLDKESTLHVHHRVYLRDCEPWDIPSKYLVCLCEACHQQETDEMPEMSGGLIMAVKTKFLVSDFVDLTSAFYSLKLVHAPNIVASAIRHWFKDEDLMKSMVDTYMEYLSTKQEPNDDLPL